MIWIFLSTVLGVVLSDNGLLTTRFCCAFQLKTKTISRRRQIREPFGVAGAESLKNLEWKKQLQLWSGKGEGNIDVDSTPLIGMETHHRHVREAIQQSSPTNQAKRIFHGRGGMFPGCEHLTVDYFHPVWLVTSYNIELSESELNDINSWLAARWEEISDLVSISEDGEETKKDIGNELPLSWVYQHRSINTTDVSTRIMSGAVPDTHIVKENGLKFLVQLPRAKNHGIFLDMANGREWVKDNSMNKNVLNLFAYTCGFSIAALHGGAKQVVNVDMAKGPMKIGQKNHQLNNFSSTSDSEGVARFLTHDIFKTWGKIKKLGLYDIIVVDPPSFQKNSFVAGKDYTKILRRLPNLLNPNGKVLLCLNAPELSSGWLKEQVSESAPQLQFEMRLPNPDTFPALNAEKALKVLVYTLSGTFIEELADTD